MIDAEVGKLMFAKLENLLVAIHPRSDLEALLVAGASASNYWCCVAWFRGRDNVVAVIKWETMAILSYSYGHLCGRARATETDESSDIQVEVLGAVAERNFPFLGDGGCGLNVIGCDARDLIHFSILDKGTNGVCCEDDSSVETVLSDKIELGARPPKIDQALGSNLQDVFGVFGYHDAQPKGSALIAALIAGKNRLGGVGEMAADKTETAFLMRGCDLEQFVPYGHGACEAVEAKVSRFVRAALDVEAQVTIVCVECYFDVRKGYKDLTLPFSIVSSHSKSCWGMMLSQESELRFYPTCYLATEARATYLEGLSGIISPTTGSWVKSVDGVVADILVEIAVNPHGSGFVLQSCRAYASWLNIQYMTADRPDGDGDDLRDPCR